MNWSGASSRPWRPEPHRRRGAAGPTAAVLAVLAAALAVPLSAPPAAAQALPAPGSAGASAHRLVVLPLENASESPAAAAIAPRVAAELASRGWTVVAGDEVDAALAAARIRRLDSLPAAERERLLAAFGAEGYVATTVLAYRADGLPQAAVAVRLVGADGLERFGDVRGLTAEDLLGALDPRPDASIERVADRVVAELFADFPSAGAPTSPRPPERAPVRLGAPATYRAAALDALPEPRRVAVLPFRTFAREREAPRIAALLAGRWLAETPGFETVEPADVRAALVAAGIRDVRDLDSDRLVEIGRHLGATLFLQGTVYRWTREAPAGAQAAPPEVELHLRLIDPAAGRILWSCHQRRRGDQYRGLLGLGAVSNVVALADRAVAEMFAAEQAASPVGPRPRGEGRAR